jgi:D-galactose 1-dehydrogenase
VAPIKIALIGLGKIARDEHIPALRANKDFELTAVASPHHKLQGLPNFSDLGSAIAGAPAIAAVALCTPPQVRYSIALQALKAGLHVLLEKPPGVTVSEVVALADTARRQGVTLFASWHSRHARAVEPARAWLEGRRIRRVTVTWKEDVRVWHPGQTWIWKAGGLGVFDPGINALSILTRIIPGAWLLKEADLHFPQNCATPIAASLALDAGGIPAQVDLDFLQTGPQTWSIDIETDSGRLELSMGGKDLTLDGQAVSTVPSTEYPALYAHFAELVHEARSDVDIAPLQLVADAFLCGRRTEVAAFIE